MMIMLNKLLYVTIISNLLINCLFMIGNLILEFPILRMNFSKILLKSKSKKIYPISFVKSRFSTRHK